MLERLHIGEPSAIDLVNTEWATKGEHVDYLAEPGAVRAWLTEYGFDPDATEPGALLNAREAIRRFLDAPGTDADTGLNAVLAHGSERPVVRDGRTFSDATVDGGWDAGWDVARSFLRLQESSPDRIRQCAHPDCVLYFVDTSRNGTRRWHSMDTCGARAKSARHYRRAQVVA